VAFVVSRFGCRSYGGARVDGVRDLVGKLELGSGRLRAEAKLQVYVRVRPELPARVDRSNRTAPVASVSCVPRRNVLSSTGSTCRGATAAPS